MFSLGNSPGKYHSVSYFRRLVTDLMYFSAKVPCVTIERRMCLAPLIEARQACARPPSWSAIFTKAYALVAARTPRLRTCYLSFPWPRLYENAVSVATVNVDRQLADERIVIHAYISAPETLSLPALDEILQHYKNEPVENLSSYMTGRRVSMIPWPLRRWAWWAALNILGPIRCHFFGTFGITSVCSFGSGILNLVPLLTSTLHYGMFDTAGRMAMRLAFDHRVIDAATAAQALADMEKVLLSEVLEECMLGRVTAAS